MSDGHVPVLVDRVVASMAPVPDGVYIDATIGAGGHAAALLDAGAGRIIGLDRDPAAVALASHRLADRGDRARVIHGDYRQIVRVLADGGLVAVDGVLVDLGVSSMQLDDPARGFSFRVDGPLDMRMDPTSGTPLAVRLATVDEPTLADVIFQFGEERRARRVAREIVRARGRQPIRTTTDLASVVRRAVGGGHRSRIDPATRTFQALRIWTNQELEGLGEFLETAVRVLVPGGRLVVIAFHSLEDRVVKHTFRRLAAASDVRALTKKPVVPDADDVRANPRARSARLRAVEKMA